MRPSTRKLNFSLALLLLMGGANSAFAITCQSAASDTDGDGWGFENGNSCKVATGTTTPTTTGGSTCVDTGVIGDGWGWNGTESCPVGATTPNNHQSSSTCVDTGVIGDGWGWNGTESCPVGSNQSPDGNSDSETAECIDTLPLGDGWGWDGTSSCLVTDSSPGGNGGNGGNGGLVNNDPVEAACEDTPPINDGWGWDGSTACRIEIEYPTAAACLDSNLDGEYTNGVSTCKPTLVNYTTTLNVFKNGVRPTIDGVHNYYNEWSGATIRSINNTLVNLDNSNPSTGSLYLKHNGSYLYIMLKQYNPTVFTDSPGSTRLYDDDGWELYFNLGNEASSTYDINDRHLMGDWGLTTSYGRPRTLNGINTQRTLYPSAKCASSNDVRTCEMRIYLGSIGADGPTSKTIGFDVHINGDNDGGERDYKLGFCGPAGVDTAWTNPSSIRCAIRIRH